MLRMLSMIAWAACGVWSMWTWLTRGRPIPSPQPDTQPTRTVHGAGDGSWRAQQRFLPLLVAAALCGGGIALRWPALVYAGPPDSRAFNSFTYRTFSYSDIASLFYRDNLSTHPRPYLDYQLEYPVGTGLFIYLVNYVQMPAGYFLLSSLLLALAGCATTWLIPQFPRGRSWLLALSPSLALYVNLNWDLWAILLTTLALLLFLRRHDSAAAVCLAAAVWTKFFPIVLVPLLVVERLRTDRHRDALRFAAMLVLVSVMINLPLLVLRPTAWWYFFAFNQQRGREVNLWTLVDRWGLTTAQINTASALLLVAGIALLSLCLWRGHQACLVPACCAALGWFFFVNKVYSPQYSLWIVVLLAAAGAPAAVAVAWSGVDLLYFAASFLILGLGEVGNQDVTAWFFAHALLPAMVIREGMLLVVTGWCVWSMWRPRGVADVRPRPTSPSGAGPARSVSETTAGNTPP